MRAGLKVVLVVAIGENGIIGRDGQLPWKLRSDLQHFRRVTTNHPIIMGRKTYASIGRVLPERTNIVVTRDPSFTVPGAVVVPGMDAAFDQAREDANRRGVDAVMVIGGNEIFALTMADADVLEITRVHAAPEGDVTFPEIDPAQWREVRSERHARGPHDDAEFTVLTYERVR